MSKVILVLIMAWQISSCETLPDFDRTVSKVEIDRFMGEWFVIASRPTFLEKGAHNAKETYTWDSEEQRIDVNFTFNQGAFDGEKESIPQIATVFDTKSNAHWKISTWWMPFQLGYLIIALDEDYKWTAVGVPNRKYLWIMAKTRSLEPSEYEMIVNRLKEIGYPVNDLQMVPQQAK